jgi:hypothetical protein
MRFNQLGFRLEPARDSVEVVVIDRAERPRPDQAWRIVAGASPLCSQL